MKSIKEFILENDNRFDSKEGKFDLDKIISTLSDISRKTGYDEIKFGCHSYSTKDVGLCLYDHTAGNIIKFIVTQDNKVNSMKYNEFIKILDDIDNKKVTFIVENKTKSMNSHAIVNTVKSFKIYESLGNSSFIQVNFEIL